MMEGRKVKWTLERAQTRNPALVRVDWLRFTLPLDGVLRFVPYLNQDLSFLDLMDQSGRDAVRRSRAADMSDVPSTARTVARAGAEHLCSMLPGFVVGRDERGMDFYSARTELLFEGEVVGHVLAGGKSDKQASTVHFNLFGSACLHLGAPQLNAIRQWIDEGCGWITRCDLALDCFTGYEVPDVRTAYLAGEFDVRGKRPGQEEMGSWTLGHSRTFQVGSRDTGKLFRGYEKGDQLLGHEANDPWVRFEVELRNNHRIIDTGILTRPGDYFAGAYPFCARVMCEREAECEARTICTTAEVADRTAHAAAVRVARWAARTAAPTVWQLLEHGGDLLGTILDREKFRMPRRLVGFTKESIKAALSQVAEAMAPASVPSTAGA